MDTTIFEKDGKLTGICSNIPRVNTFQYKKNNTNNKQGSVVWFLVKVLTGGNPKFIKTDRIPVTMFSNYKTGVLAVQNNSSMQFTGSLNDEWSLLSNCLISCFFTIVMKKEDDKYVMSLTTNEITILKTSEEVVRLYPEQDSQYNPTPKTSDFRTAGRVLEDGDDIPF